MTAASRDPAAECLGDVSVTHSAAQQIVGLTVLDPQRILDSEVELRVTESVKDKERQVADPYRAAR